jgi:hypothetical protein
MFSATLDLEVIMTGSVAVGVRWRLGARARKSVLLLHIASAGAWLGSTR